MKVYICIIENKRSEATAEVFSTSEAAINYARELAKSMAHDSEEKTEFEVEGCLYAANYSYDGLGVFVVEKELDTAKMSKEQHEFQLEFGYLKQSPTGAVGTSVDICSVCGMPRKHPVHSQARLEISMPVKESPDYPDRLILTGYNWPDNGIDETCAHGVKMRWTCDDCDEFFGKDGEDEE